MNSKKVLSLASIFLCLLCSSFNIYNVNEDKSYCFSDDDYISDSLIQQFNMNKIVINDTCYKHISFENSDSYDENATDLETLKRINWLDVWD